MHTCMIANYISISQTNTLTDDVGAHVSCVAVTVPASQQADSQSLISVCRRVELVEKHTQQTIQL